MSPRRLDNLDPERQRVLFEATAEEFSAHGFEAASLNRILEKSGLSKSSLYYYFDDKADLFATLVERSLAVLFKQIGALDPETLGETDFWDEIALRYARGTALVSGNGWMVKFGGMFHELRADPRRGSATGRVFGIARHWMGRLITRGQTLGVIRSDLPQTLLIDSSMGLLESLDRWVVANWSDLSASERAALPSLHIGLFKDFLAPRPAGRGGNIDHAGSNLP